MWVPRFRPGIRKGPWLTYCWKYTGVKRVKAIIDLVENTPVGDLANLINQAERALPGNPPDGLRFRLTPNGSPLTLPQLWLFAYAKAIQTNKPNYLNSIFYSLGWGYSPNGPGGGDEVGSGFCSKRQP